MQDMVLLFGYATLFLWIFIVTFDFINTNADSLLFDNSDPLLIDVDEIDSYISNYDTLLVIFGASWCSHSKDSFESLKQASNLVRQASEARIALVETSDNFTFRSSFNLVSFPSYQLFKHGLYVADYVGPTDGIALSNYVIRNSDNYELVEVVSDSVSLIPSSTLSSEVNIVIFVKFGENNLDFANSEQISDKFKRRILQNLDVISRVLIDDDVTIKLNVLTKKEEEIEFSEPFKRVSVGGLSWVCYSSLLSESALLVPNSTYFAMSETENIGIARVEVVLRHVYFPNVNCFPNLFLSLQLHGDITENELFVQKILNFYDEYKLLTNSESYNFGGKLLSRDLYVNMNDVEDELDLDYQHPATIDKLSLNEIPSFLIIILAPNEEVASDWSVSAQELIRNYKSAILAKLHNIAVEDWLLNAKFKFLILHDMEGGKEYLMRKYKINSLFSSCTNAPTILSLEFSHFDEWSQYQPRQYSTSCHVLSSPTTLRHVVYNLSMNSMESIASSDLLSLTSSSSNVRYSVESMGLASLTKFCANNSQTSVIFLFHIPSCVYCKSVFPTFQQVAESFSELVPSRLKFVSYDASENSIPFHLLIDLPPDWFSRGFPLIAYKSAAMNSTYVYQDERVSFNGLFEFVMNLARAEYSPVEVIVIE